MIFVMFVFFKKTDEKIDTVLKKYLYKIVFITVMKFTGTRSYFSNGIKHLKN
jgi:Mor family transcriptional regulator